MDLDPFAWIVHRHVVDVTIDEPDVPFVWVVADRERPRFLDAPSYDAALANHLATHLRGDGERAVPRAVRG
jgi:hypothetical protein